MTEVSSRQRRAEPPHSSDGADRWAPGDPATRASQVRARYLAYLERAVDGDDAAALAEEDQLAADLQADIEHHETP